MEARLPSEALAVVFVVADAVVPLRLVVRCPALGTKREAANCRRLLPKVAKEVSCTCLEGVQEDSHTLWQAL